MPQTGVLWGFRSFPIQPKCRGGEGSFILKKACHEGIKNPDRLPDVSRVLLVFFKHRARQRAAPPATFAGRLRAAEGNLRTPKAPPELHVSFGFIWKPGRLINVFYIPVQFSISRKTINKKKKSRRQIGNQKANCEHRSQLTWNKNIVNNLTNNLF